MSRSLCLKEEGGRRFAVSKFWYSVVLGPAKAFLVQDHLPRQGLAQSQRQVILRKPGFSSPFCPPQPQALFGVLLASWTMGGSQRAPPTPFSILPEVPPRAAATLALAETPQQGNENVLSPDKPPPCGWGRHLDKERSGAGSQPPGPVSLLRVVYTGHGCLSLPPLLKGNLQTSPLDLVKQNLAPRGQFHLDSRPRRSQD